ncbi:MAG: paraquat-inducible protein A [Planctomycetaceae bacterium]
MPLHSCHCCGLIQTTHSLSDEVCCRCESELGAWWGGDSRNRLAMALSLTALVLYLPAVNWKFLRIEQLGRVHESSLLQGVRALLSEGELFVGVIVLLFSIIFPVVKLSAIVFLCQSRWQMQARHRAITYRAVEHLGRWGMLDVLLVAVMVAFIKLGGLVSFTAGPGVVLFAMFVVLSVCASLAFDPHCLWAVASESGAAPEPPPSPPVSTLAEPASAPSPQYPPARKRTSWFHWPTWGVWLIPILTLILVGGIAIHGWLNQPRRIEITFQQGHGIQAGDELRYHGVVVGEVDTVRFSDSLKDVVVGVKLTPDGSRLSHEGSRFWVVRPQFDLTGITGLDTVVGAKYIAVQPGEGAGQVVRQFRGLDEPPLPDLDFPGGIEVMLESLDAQGLSPGTAVYYRRLRIGGVISSGLNLNQSRVVARVYIRPEYRDLIRSGTVFWNMSGVRFNGGLTELSVHIGPAESLLQGGIGVAVPPSPGEPVSDGFRYRLAPKADKEWFEWQPELGACPVPPPAQLPLLTPAKLQWTHDGLLRNSLRTRTGWVLTLDGKTHGPADLLTVPEDEIASTASLTIGKEVFDEAKIIAAGDTAQGLTSAAFPENADAKLRQISIAEDCFLVTGGDQPPVFVAAGLLHSDGKAWSLDPDLPLSSQHHGGALVAHKDGAILGIVSVAGREFKVMPIAP